MRYAALTPASQVPTTARVLRPPVPALALLAFASLTLAMTGARGAAVIVPASGNDFVDTTAADLARIWGRAAGISVPVLVWGTPAAKQAAPPVIFLGDVGRAETAAPVPAGVDPDTFRVAALPDGRVYLRGPNPRATAYAAYWYAGQAWHARWFRPGPRGETVPPSPRWWPAALNALVQPAFLSRDLLLPRDSDSRLWALRNGLGERWQVTHAMTSLISPADRALHPDWLPWREGARYRPSSAADYDWQPDLTSPAVITHVAARAKAYFRSHPDAASFSVGENDSVRFDQSPQTLAARGPLRWFRGRPDYSNLFFAFANAVARDVKSVYPDRLITTLAYYWCENTPQFRVEPNVLPWLTSDRSQWYDRRYAAQDKALIRRWCRDGPREVGCYEYLDGAGYLVPVFAPHLLGESIGFESDAGVRGFFGEASPGWAYDAPRLWLAAQLLWNPHRPVDRLLQEYYRDYFGPAAAPIGDFFSSCERAWMGQTTGARWLMYFFDEDQALLFPAPLRARLRRDLADAQNAAAGHPEFELRIGALAAAFGVTDAFCSMNEARTDISNAAASCRGGTDNPQQLEQRMAEFISTRTLLIRGYQRSSAIGASPRQSLSAFLINDPIPRALLVLGRSGPSGRAALAEFQASYRETGAAAAAPDIDAALSAATAKWSPAPISDPAWTTLHTPAMLDDTTFRWTNGPWFGTGEPCQGRSIRVLHRGTETVVQYRHAYFEHLSQWISVRPGTLYRVSLMFSGRVEKSDQEYLVASWVDRNGSFLSTGQDRVPPGNWSRPRQLLVIERAPATASRMGIAIYSCHQSAGSLAEFSGLTCQASPYIGPQARD